MKKYILLLLTVLSFASCSDWLDVTPNDKKLEDDLFSSESEINTANNGLYRELIGESLYGGNLTQTSLGMMGHAYIYPESQPSNGNVELVSWALANFNFTQNDETKKIFTDIWKNSYAALLHINTYIKNVNESPAVISEQNKKILLGEAYGLRAYVHFDLFRLFGPAWKDKNNNKILPYHNKAEVTMNHTGYEESEYSTADEYMALLLEDIKIAQELLVNDPIVSDAGSITNTLPNENFYQNRNRRMNYYALKGLEARVRQYCGEYALAAAAAKVVTDQVGSDKRFKWVDRTKMLAQNNYIFFSEVIFGINNLNMVSNGETWYSGYELRKAYVLDLDNLMKNILGYDGGSLDAIIDIRARQWQASNISNFGAFYSGSGTYKSKKYLNFVFPNDGKDIPAIKNLQVLMRISEMYYIQAEAALNTGNKSAAADLLNTVLLNRGLTQQYMLTDNMTIDEFRAHIQREYYREFIGEGQVFFYHKRLNSKTMYNGYGEGTSDVKAPYVVPVPQSETDI